MKSMVTCFIAAVLIISTLSTNGAAQKLYENSNPLWQPVKDEVYLQESVKKIRTNQPVTSIALFEGHCYLLMNSKIYRLTDGAPEQLMQAPQNVYRLMVEAGALWALSEKGLYSFNSSWQLIDEQKFVDLTIHNGAVYGATRDDLFRFENGEFINVKPEGGYYSSNMTMFMEDGTQLHADPVKIGPIKRIASYSGTIYILRSGRLALFDGKIVNQDFLDWGRLPSSNTHDLLSYGSRLFISTDRGLSLLRGAAITTLTGKDGLPYEKTTCLQKGFAADLWIGTTRGAIRMVNGDWHYFGADHWLPGDRVYAIATGDSRVYIATEKGLGIVEYQPYTLRKKAAYYERHLNEWGHKRLGFVHKLYIKNNEWVREVSDNDGGHTAPYLAAMCYKYMVTGDEADREEAVNSFMAMVWLDRITPRDGFIARAIWSTTGDLDKRGRHGSGGLPAKWYPTSDGKWYWKGDTSSDEVIAHFYAVSIFHDLIAEGDEKELAKEHLRRMASHIVDNGWVLIDMNGKPTRWGRWDANYLLNPYGWVDKGINGLEAQAFMKTAYGITRDVKYKKAFQQLMDWGYQNYTVRQKNTFPPENNAPWDDMHAFRSYYTLLRYTSDPQLRSIYLRSLERTWEVKRMERIAWFNFTYGALTGNDCEAEQAVQGLREWTLDCTIHNYFNSHRSDLTTAAGYVPYEGVAKAISPRESSVKGGSRNALNYDGGSGGRAIAEPTGFLRDYWMGRYHGFISAPQTEDPDLLTVKPRSGKSFGARPYNGPDRPKIKTGN